MYTAYIMESPPQTEHAPITEVKRLHFLIHPGFLRDPASDDLEVRKSETDERYTQWNSLINFHGLTPRGISRVQA
jgi:hypothetical protein